MKYFYSLLISVVFLFATGTAQDATTIDLNGDIIPHEAAIAYSLNQELPVAVEGMSEMRAEWMGKGPWGGNIRGFATDKTDGMNVVVACGHSMASNGGIWYSEDGGQSWNSSSINNKVMYAVAAHPTQTGVFYAGGAQGLYQSTDGGATWTNIAYPGTTLIGVGIQTANTDMMVAGIASNQGVRYSDDGGATWNNTNLTQGFMKDFAVSPANPQLMFLAVSGTSGSGLYTSTDGATWTAINPATSGQCYGVYVDPVNVSTIILGAQNGIFKSTDGGSNWTQAQATSNYARNIVPFDGSLYTAVYNGGIYQSDDNGDTWTLSSQTFVEKTWQAIGVSDEGVLFGNWGSVFLGHDNSYQLSVYGMNNAYVHSVVYYADRNELWAGSEGSGIWVSNDYGETWTNKSNGLQGWWIYTFSPTDHNDWTVDRMMVATNNGVFYSDNYGDNWSLLDQSTTYYVGAMIHWTDPDIMWVAGATGPIKFTTDGGVNWTTSAGLPFAFYARFGLCENSSGNPRVILLYEQLATNAYYSDDLGANFTAAGGLGGVSYFTDISVRKAGNGLDQMVYMSTDQGIFKSADGQTYTVCPQLSGLSWSVLGSSGTDVYAGANNGIFHSPDEGQTWQPFNQGIEGIAIWDIVYGNTTDDLFAGTRGYSVYKYGEGAASYSLPFNESFSGGQLPADWQNNSNIGNDQIWQFDNPGGRNITGAGFDDDFAILDSDEYGSGSTQDADLITPPVNCSDAAFVSLAFDQSFRQYQTSVGTLSVSNNGADWTVIYTVEENSGYPNPAVSLEFDISSVAAGQPEVWVKWNFIGSYEYWWAIDNVSIFEGSGPVLPGPENLEAVVSGNNVNLSWDAPAPEELLGYNIYRDEVLVNPSPVTQTTYQDQNVTPGTHLYGVSAVYDNGESAKAGPVQVLIEGGVGKIHGFVRDAVTNLAIDEAMITASNTDNGVMTFMTPFGAYYSLLLPEGFYDVTCSADGYQPFTLQNATVFENMNKAYTFYLQPAGEILTGMGINSNVPFGFYPNPATDQLIVSGNEMLRVEIISQTGEVVLSSEHLSDQETIDISHLPAGIYVVKMTGETSVVTKKLIIK